MHENNPRKINPRNKSAQNFIRIRIIANIIHLLTQVDVDCPSNLDNRMPFLDLKVWVENKNGRSVIMHEYYAKNISSKMVINANSALPMNTKRTAQEGLPPGRRGVLKYVG